MGIRRGTMATDRPARYAKQLAGHWASKGTSTVDEDAALIRFDSGQIVRLVPSDGVLQIEVEVPDADPHGFAEVVARHLERFGQRDELSVVWQS